MTSRRDYADKSWYQTKRRNWAADFALIVVNVVGWTYVLHLFIEELVK